jgi:ABC-type transporter Mla MlaB component
MNSNPAPPWLAVRYLPVSSFSLKSALATSSGGKTLLVPTPYAIKMALLDAAIRAYGVAAGERLFPLLRDLRVALAVPSNLVVQNSFGKIRRPWEAPKKKGADTRAAVAADLARRNYPWKATIAYREFVQYGGPLSLAFATLDGTDPAPVAALLPCINYLGRRGGFLQIAAPPEHLDALPALYRMLTDPIATDYGEDWTLQMLDDCAPTLTFSQANIYTDDRIILGKQRVLRHVPLPLRLARSSRSFSLYTRIEPDR